MNTTSRVEIGNIWQVARKTGNESGGYLEFNNLRKTKDKLAEARGHLVAKGRPGENDPDRVTAPDGWIEDLTLCGHHLVVKEASPGCHQVQNWRWTKAQIRSL